MYFSNHWYIKYIFFLLNKMPNTYNILIVKCWILLEFQGMKKNMKDNLYSCSYFVMIYHTL